MRLPVNELTYSLSCTVFQLPLIISGQIIAFDKRAPVVNALVFGNTSVNIAVSHILLKNYIIGLHFFCRRQLGLSSTF